ncbi:hypothetical protein Scep_016463 [Stephania cephalantha]|uniref:Uncharacterized protein n=1 Tax=Stephania cephalantha TaxID=152367 RepID=A0AAP0IN92_9MAGN
MSSLFLSVLSLECLSPDSLTLSSLSIISFSCLWSHVSLAGLEKNEEEQNRDCWGYIDQRISLQGNLRNVRGRTRITNLRLFDCFEPKEDRKGKRKLEDFC